MVFFLVSVTKEWSRSIGHLTIITIVIYYLIHLQKSIIRQVVAYYTFAIVVCCNYEPIGKYAAASLFN